MSGKNEPRQPMRCWFACSEPERPPDAYVMWHYSGCTPCAVKAAVQLSRYPNSAVVARILGPIAERAFGDEVFG